MDSVSWVQMDTGLMGVISSLEICGGYCYLGAIGYRTYTGIAILRNIN
jgi:hypothetical protein